MNNRSFNDRRRRLCKELAEINGGRWQDYKDLVTIGMAFLGLAIVATLIKNPPPDLLAHSEQPGEITSPEPKEPT